MANHLTNPRLVELETTIERGQQTFIEVGLALAEIRESKLYRANFATFEEYCQIRWGWSASRSRKLISSAEAVASMKSGNTFPLVQNARQATELAKIKDPQIRAQVWTQVNEFAAEIETTVTAKLVKEAVEAEKQIELRKSGNGVELPSPAEILAENKQSAGYRWRDALYKAIVIINSIRSLGGIVALSAKWTPEQRRYYAESCREYAETFHQYAEEIDNL